MRSLPMAPAAVLVAVALLACAAPARGEVPLAVRAMAGPGMGGGRFFGTGIGGFGGILAIDVEWRDRPGHAYVLSSEASAVGTSKDLVYVDPVAPFPHYGGPNDVTSGALLFGIERSKGSSITSYMHAGIGPGWVLPDPGSHGSAIGVALTGGVGVRLVGRPGPIGLVIGLRTSHVIAEGARAHVLAVMLGLTAYAPEAGDARDVGASAR